MSIRNKRLMKEQHRLDKYEIHWPKDWTHLDVVTIKTVQYNLYISMRIGLKYPFVFPKMYVHPNFKEGIDYIEWFMNLRNKNKDIIDHFGLKIECVCCENITCHWTPSYGVENMLQDFSKHHHYYNMFDKFRIIYKKINGFDDLIYKNIISYLIYNGGH
jgi:hypothetical protein